MTGPRIGSLPWQVAQLAVGERFYVECDYAHIAQMQRALNPPQHRRPASIKANTYTTTVFTAVGQRAGECRILVGVERIS